MQRAEYGTWLSKYSGSGTLGDGRSGMTRVISRTLATILQRVYVEDTSRRVAFRSRCRNTLRLLTSSFVSRIFTSLVDHHSTFTHVFVILPRYDSPKINSFFQQRPMDFANFSWSLCLTGCLAIFHSRKMTASLLRIFTNAIEHLRWATDCGP